MLHIYLKSANLEVVYVFQKNHVYIIHEDLYSNKECIFAIQMKEKALHNNTVDNDATYDHVVKYAGLFGGVQGLTMLIGILRDVADLETEREKKVKNQQHTVEVADSVIEKQMRIVQEIASLLGETAAETKIALTKLKESIGDE